MKGTWRPGPIVPWPAFSELARLGVTLKLVKQPTRLERNAKRYTNEAKRLRAVMIDLLVFVKL